MDLTEARRQLSSLTTQLQRLVDKDPEQEVRGVALPVLDAVIAAVRPLVPDSEVLDTVADIISIESIEIGEPLRAADVLIVVTIMQSALPAPTMRAGALTEGLTRPSPWRIE